MSPERLEQLENLYNEALAVPALERRAFVDRVCADDNELGNELSSLLNYEEKAENYLEAPAVDVVAGAMAETRGGVLIDRRLGRYQLLSLVGRGGMGEVYCAVDTRLNRLVAVKVLPSYLVGDPERLRRFEQEARAIAALNHPHICTLHDIGSDDQMPYLVFEYLAGELLSDRLSRERMAASEALAYVMQICDALSHAHEHGVLHLDLKPQNIMITRTGAKLFDFGIAELRDGGNSSGEVAEAKTSGAIRAGTPGYLAPEQSAGGVTDARTDVFSFGVVMYELFTGERFQNSTTTGPVPTALDSVMRRCLATEPGERWASMVELYAQLKSIQ
jgi:eukaryotic-like serine/threonine-protein kinase